MKKITVKMKITLWYSGIMILLTAGVLFVVVTFSEKLTFNRAEGNLKSELHNFMENIIINDRGLSVEDDEEFYEDGISFSIYNADGKLVKGIVPGRFPLDTVLKNGTGQTISYEREKWLTYDEAIHTHDQTIFWIRAVASAGDLSSMGQIIILIAIISIPILAVFSIIGGYYVTGKALMPVEEALIREQTFTSDASHELRTPVSVIMSESEYALLPDSTNADKEESLQIILTQAHHMSDLISQLLTLTRSGNETECIKLQPVNISLLVHTVAGMMEEYATQRSITMETDIQPDLIVHGDESSLTRMFINLLDNSIRYGRSGGYVRLTLSKNNSGIVGTVSDNGSGISKEHLPHIWERFYQADSSRTKTDYNGHGLGLPMVQWIIHAHQGSIRTESEENQGTTFFFSLPTAH